MSSLLLCQVYLNVKCIFKHSKSICHSYYYVKCTLMLSVITCFPLIRLQISRTVRTKQGDRVITQEALPKLFRPRNILFIFLFKHIKRQLFIVPIQKGDKSKNFWPKYPELHHIRIVHYCSMTSYCQQFLNLFIFYRCYKEIPQRVFQKALLSVSVNKCMFFFKCHCCF